MQARIGLGYKIWQAFIFQALLISITAILGVFAARYVLSDVLIKAALQEEADYFWVNYETDKQFPRPDTYNLTAYLSGLDDVPNVLASLSPGFHEIQNQDSDLFVIYVSEKNNRRLWLAFDGKQVSELAIFFGLIPLAIVLIVIYLSSWLGYRFSRRAISPIVKLAREVERIEPRLLSGEELNTVFFSEDMDQEVAVLAKALEDFSERIKHFLDRERNFTRDASHELRSPITVIRIATDVILQDESLSESAHRFIERIQRSVADMEELIEVLLLLARESEDQLSFESVCINDLVEEEIERLELIYPNKPVTVMRKETCRLVIEASDKVLSVMIGNILRNAFSYTDEGQIEVNIEPSAISIRDSGVGMSEQEIQQVFKPFFQIGQKQRGGYGVGLTIVRMLSDRFHWKVDIESMAGVGTQVKVTFPAYRIIHC